MKKLLFVLTLIFLTNNLYSQVYMAILNISNSVTNPGTNNPSGCIDEYVLVKIDPSGNITYDCLGATILYDDYTPLSNLNKGLNSIINQGYKLINITNPSPHGGATTNQNGGGLISNTGTNLEIGTAWYFAIP